MFSKTPILTAAEINELSHDELVTYTRKISLRVLRTYATKIAIVATATVVLVKVLKSDETETPIIEA